MFKNEKIYLIEKGDRCVRLEDEGGKTVALIFINSDGVIVRGDVNIFESTIERPVIKKI